LAGAAADPAGAFEALVEAARLGASLGEIARAGRSGGSAGPEVPPLAPLRLAADFEELRRWVLAWRRGRPDESQVVVVPMGSAPDLAATTDFARGFFEAGGFRVEVAPEGGAGVAAVVLAVGKAERAQLAETLRGSPVKRLYLAEPPGPDATELRQAGLADFVHPRADAPALLRSLAEALGVGS
jgi:methylmalonyl-CoA mutase